MVESTTLGEIPTNLDPKMLNVGKTGRSEGGRGAEVSGGLGGNGDGWQRGRRTGFNNF